jgi:hypothetical protein
MPTSMLELRAVRNASGEPVRDVTVSSFMVEHDLPEKAISTLRIMLQILIKS